MRMRSNWKLVKPISWNHIFHLRMPQIKTQIYFFWYESGRGFCKRTCHCKIGGWSKNPGCGNGRQWWICSLLCDCHRKGESNRNNFRQDISRGKRGEKLTLNVTASPSYASNKKVVWKSANTKIATVDANGSVTAKAPGRTKITVTSSENSSYQASCTVTVPYKITYKLNKGKNNASNPSTYYGKKVTLKIRHAKDTHLQAGIRMQNLKRRSQVSATAQNPITFCMQSGQK